MKKIFSVIFIIVILQLSCRPHNIARKTNGSVGTTKPKLVLAIVLDQFRYDYLQRFRNEYTAGMEQLLTKGAVFLNARYDHVPTVTSVGHAAFMTGAYPSVHGIMGYQWFDRKSGKVIDSAADDSVKLIGGNGGSAASPHNLLTSTIGDEIKIANKEQCKVLSISLKDYSAILSAGHMADGVFWFDSKSGNFVSSSYYMSDLPVWAKAFNARRLADSYKGKTWHGIKLDEEPGSKLNAKLPVTPFGNELVEEMAESAIKGEQIGRHSQTDLLVLSFSANDYVGHEFGPDSVEARDMAIAADKLLGKLFAFLDAKIGMANVTVVLTADHGVAPMPEVNTERKMPGGRVSTSKIRDAIQKGLVQKFGRGDWISRALDESIYLNWDLINSKKLDRESVNRVAAQAALTIPHVARVYTREQLLNGYGMGDPIGRRVMHSFSAQRGADLYILFDPYYITSSSGTTHGSPYGYDTHVPVIFMGPGIKTERFGASIVVNDIAPTLATILDIETPIGAEGRILSEIFDRP
jgi:predicted AlkP superfamily pyrophosphatase or phosphodiesterase